MAAPVNDGTLEVQCMPVYGQPPCIVAVEKQNSAQRRCVTVGSGGRLLMRTWIGVQSQQQYPITTS